MRPLPLDLGPSNHSKTLTPTIEQAQMVPAVAFQSGAVKHHMICIVYGCAAAPLSHARKLTHEVPDNRNIIWMGVEWTSPYYDVGRTRFKDMAACQGKADHQGWKECLL